MYDNGTITLQAMGDRNRIQHHPERQHRSERETFKEQTWVAGMSLTPSIAC